MIMEARWSRTPERLHRVRTLGVDEHKMLAAGPKHHTVHVSSRRASNLGGEDGDLLTKWNSGWDRWTGWNEPHL